MCQEQKLVTKGLVAWTDSPVGKVSIQKGFPMGQVGLNAEMPLSMKGGGGQLKPTFGLSIVLAL